MPSIRNPHPLGRGGCQVSDSYFETIKGNKDTLFSADKKDYYKNEVQIQWKEPEKKIEITKSEFNELVKNSRYQKNDYGEEWVDIDMLKQKLFGAENE